jgi:hypothetical protein
MTMAPQDFLPQIADWVSTLDDIWPGAAVKPYFAHWEVLHILSLIMLGGASILLNLRIIGYGLTEDSPSTVERNVRTWMNVGVIGILITGLLIGASNPDRLYTSEAFTAKMLALAAGLILTYGVSLPVGRADGRMSRAAAIAGLIGLVFWGLSLFVFSTGKLINPGLWHVLTAGALMVVFMTRGFVRLIYLFGLTLLGVVMFVMTRMIIGPEDYARLDPATKAFAYGFAAWIIAAAAVQILTDDKGPAGRAPKAFAYCAILVWVTAAAAGRWIAFA